MASAVAVAGAVPFAPPPAPPGREAWAFREELARPSPLPRFAPPAVATNAYWVENRISRCYFGPIKRPPLNHDELLDDLDYYPEPYLERLRREGVNGLWLTVEWRELATTALTARDPQAERRLAKLRQTVDRCLKYGIKTWIFCIEPKACSDDDPLFQAHPEMFGCTSWRGRVMCPLVPLTQRYVEESVGDLFRRVPRLGGMMMIAHGERATTCLSAVDPVTGEFTGECERCRQVRPWQIHWATASAIMRGIRAAGSDAQLISWFYHPEVPPERGEWVAEVARHLPEGVTMAYNFESGAVKEQLGQERHGGDYWLSFVGPAAGFRQVAAAGREVGAKIGAKIQVCSSHECATVPFVPVPGLLYRKYRAMRELGVSSVLQCWYFGNYPGLMNEAAGLLSRDDFTETEAEFLQRLAAPHWGPDAALMAGLWQQFSDAYAEYPLSNNMQYYGPFHAGVAWPLLPDVWLLPLGRTWKPQDPPSGDTIGECLENHSLEEAAILAERMAKGTELKAPDGTELGAQLAERWRDDRERRLDLGVMKALSCQFAAGADIFAFYLDRARAIFESRVRHNPAAAVAALRRMDARVTNEVAITKRLLPLAQADSRLGFHSEAEVHQYFPAKLEWRLGELRRAQVRIAEIIREVESGRPYPFSAHELKSPVCKVNGDWVAAADGIEFRTQANAGGDLTVEIRLARPRPLRVATLDAAGVSFYRVVEVAADGRVSTMVPGGVLSRTHQLVDCSATAGGGRLTVKFTLAAAGWDRRDDRRPGWVQLIAGLQPLWPAGEHPDIRDHRLNLSPMRANLFGRLDWPSCRTDP